MVISSSFTGNHDDAIRSMKIDTNVNEILLAEVKSLLAMLEGKLRNPAVSIGPDGIQRLLASSGLLLREMSENSGDFKPMAGKYTPLEQRLKALRIETRDVTMSFGQIAVDWVENEDEIEGGQVTNCLLAIHIMTNKLSCIWQRSFRD